MLSRGYGGSAPLECAQRHVFVEPLGKATSALRSTTAVITANHLLVRKTTHLLSRGAVAALTSGRGCTLRVCTSRGGTMAGRPSPRQPPRLTFGEGHIRLAFNNCRNHCQCPARAQNNPSSVPRRRRCFNFRPGVYTSCLHFPKRDYGGSSIATSTPQADLR